MKIEIVLLIVSAFVVAACTQPIPPAAPAAPISQFKAVGSIKDVMKSIVEPASNVVFAAAGEAPKDDAGWLVVEHNAIALAEAGNLLMIEGRALDNDAWMKHARNLLDKATVAVDAARAKDAAKLGESGDTIYSACEDCHKLYQKTAAAK